MEDIAAIETGTLVHGTDGVVGMVYQVRDGADQDGTLLIHGSEPDSFYRVPISLVRRVRQDGGANIAVLDADMAALERYVTSDEIPGAAGAAPGEALRVPVFEEELVAQTRSVSLGAVRLHQRVESHEERLAVPVEREEVVVEHVRPDAYDPDAPSDPDVVMIPIMEEQLVVTKRTVVREYLRVRKNRVVEQREVKDTVRRTVVEVEDLTAGGAVVK